jgi:hypothetical protein
MQAGGKKGKKRNVKNLLLRRSRFPTQAAVRKC